jgi:transcriptional regulator with PAS, ATPase and Fis domain
MVAEGEFREDLFWRIRGAEVALPPLRDRPSDLPILADAFLAQCASLAAHGKAKTLSSAAKDALLAHEWPGNLRELRFEMQRATVLAGTGPEIDASQLSFVAEAAGPRGEATTLQDRVEALERREIEAALAKFHGNRTKTAEDLGLSRQGLLNKMSRYQL